ncbi:MAG: hypothetical protein H6726_01115 [Sandaracinaceae bacterium]|nr:hypothetical protein [Sandaracinaceae bacterium]
MDPSRDQSALDAGALEVVNEVLIAVASGRFDARAPRSFDGSAMDVLAFMVNATAEEVGLLVAELEREREDLRRARDQLVLAEKLAALGELSAGVAHELNQPLTVIRMITTLLERKPNATIAESRADLAIIADASRRMGRIVDSVRAFARGGSFTMARVCPTAPIEDALVLVDEANRQSEVAVRKDYAADLPDAWADADRLQQVFVNLFVNARQALEGSPSGSERVIDVGVRATQAHIVYTVEDNGPGVASEHADRVFDPFFTTKPPGSGTGLGLSVSHGICVDHGGSLHFEPRSRGGARFIVHIPQAPMEGTP